MRRISLAATLLLVGCGANSEREIQILVPDELVGERVLASSDAVLMVSHIGDQVELRAPDSLEVLARVTGDPVWAGRESWGESALRRFDTPNAEIALFRADGADELILVPPSPQGWTYSFAECGATHCGFTWQSTDGKQHVESVSMPDLVKVKGYDREVFASSGTVSGRQPVAYHVDRGLRVVAEDQQTGDLRWTAPLDPPTDGRRTELDGYRVLVSGTGRYVMAIYGWSGRRDEYILPLLQVFDAQTGTPVRLDQARFAKLADDPVRLASVPGVDHLLIAIDTVRGGGESPDVRLVGLREVTIPSLATVGELSRSKLPMTAPAHIIPLASRRVLIMR